MARVTVEDCLEREENRFALVILAAYKLVRGDVVGFVVGSWNRFLVEVSIPVFLVGAVATRGLWRWSNRAEK